MMCSCVYCDIIYTITYIGVQVCNIIQTYTLPILCIYSTREIEMRDIKTFNRKTYYYYIFSFQVQIARCNGRYNYIHKWNTNYIFMVCES